MRWEDLTWPQLDAMDRDTVVLLPVASIEQHSLHLPVSTDSTIATNLAALLDKACDDRLLRLPTFWLGCSEHHMDFAGSLTTELDHWTASVIDIVRSVSRHGFRKLIVLNCHGGNHTIMGVTMEKLRYGMPEIQAVGVTYWHVASQAMAEVRESGFGGMGHACEMETSLMLVFSPDRVDMSQAEADGKMAESEFQKMEMMQGPSVAKPRTFKEMTHHGGYGDATLGSAEKGQRFIDGIIPRLKLVVEHLEQGLL